MVMAAHLTVVAAKHVRCSNSLLSRNCAGIFRCVACPRNTLEVRVLSPKRRSICSSGGEYDAVRYVGSAYTAARSSAGSNAGSADRAKSLPLRVTIAAETLQAASCRTASSESRGRCR